jgi:hypothetical protein
VGKIRATSNIFKKVCIVLCTGALLIGAALAIMLVSNWKSDEVPEAKAEDYNWNIGPIIYSVDFWSRSASEARSSDSYKDRIYVYMTPSQDYREGRITSESLGVRPILFIDIMKIAGYKTSIRLGACGDASYNGPSCVRFGNYAFDVVGFNRGGNLEGSCTVTQTLYSDHSGVECPDNTAMLFLSNASSQKFSSSIFHSSSNAYNGSNLQTAMNNAYSIVSNQTLQPSGPPLKDVIIPRNLICGGSHSTATGNNCVGDPVIDARFFPIAYRERTRFFKTPTSTAPPPCMTSLASKPRLSPSPRAPNLPDLCSTP